MGITECGLVGLRVISTHRIPDPTSGLGDCSRAISARDIAPDNSHRDPIGKHGLQFPTIPAAFRGKIETKANTHFLHELVWTCPGEECFHRSAEHT
jgi:hypothetical protein